MSTVDTLLAEARQHHMRLSVAGDRLKWRAPDDPPAEFLERLREYKPEIMAALTSGPASALDAWWAGVDRMNASSAPANCSPDRWAELCDGAALFLDTWSEQAQQLGWGTVDLFGAHPKAPFARTDAMGLALFLRRHVHVAALTDTTATLRRVLGHQTTFYRRSPAHPEAVPLWTLCQPRREAS